MYLINHCKRNIYLIVIIMLLLLNIYLTFFIYQYSNDNRDDNMLDYNDKVKSEYKNLTTTGEIAEERLPSSIKGCLYADVEFGLGILNEYDIPHNMIECQSIREYAGTTSSYWHNILGWFLKFSNKE